MRLRGRPLPQAALVDGGQLLAEAGIEVDKPVFTCRDVQTGAERVRLPLPEAWHFRVSSCGTNGRLVAVNMDSRPRRAGRRAWLTNLLARLSLSQTRSTVQTQEVVVFDEDDGRASAGAIVPSGYESAADSNRRKLFDAASCQTFLQTAGCLRAVSDDCRYAVTEDSNQASWKLALPVRRPIVTILLAILACSLAVIGLIAICPRRRVKVNSSPNR
jgi:hypothetical protein